jgi:hypothetical protein
VHEMFLSDAVDHVFLFFILSFLTCLYHFRAGENMPMIDSANADWNGLHRRLLEYRD